MGSDEITMPKTTYWAVDNGKKARLYAYACALSGKDRKASFSSVDKATGGTGISGLREELEKTRLDA